MYACVEAVTIKTSPYISVNICRGFKPGKGWTNNDSDGDNEKNIMMMVVKMMMMIIGIIVMT